MTLSMTALAKMALLMKTIIKMTHHKDTAKQHYSVLTLRSQK
jgi:hypothetical protein